MAHNHESCTAWDAGAICRSGVVTSTCGEDGCYWDVCVEIGHCECLCHSGKTCSCGHSWPRLAKQEKSIL